MYQVISGTSQTDFSHAACASGPIKYGWFTRLLRDFLTQQAAAETGRRSLRFKGKGRPFRELCCTGMM